VEGSPRKQELHLGLNRHYYDADLAKPTTGYERRGCEELEQAVRVLDPSGASEVLQRVPRQVLELLQALLNREKAAAPRALPPLPKDARLATKDQRGQ